MKKLTLILLGIIFSASASFAMNDAVYLRKLSLSIRGVPPSAEEYAGLASAADKAAHLQLKVREYLSSRQHRDKMVYRLSELFQIAAPSMSKAKVEDKGVEPETYSRHAFWDSTTELFARLATENKSWDELVTSKQFSAYQVGRSVSGGNDFGTFGLLEPSLLKQMGLVITPDQVGAIDPEAEYDSSKPRPLVKPIPLKFDADDLRVSGAMTTTRFLTRNGTTGVNKNRRRAAAIFRMFLCDPMIPAISSGTDRTHAFIEASFAEKYEVTENQIRTGILQADKHGTDSDCLSCHYKLDPLGKTFQNIGLTLSTTPSPGALVFKRTDGTIANEPLRGVGDLGSALAKQPEYAACQVSWFWKAFIGQDVPLTIKKKTELVEKFNSVGRRTNDFIEILVTSPEFKTAPVRSEVITFSKVEPTLKRCDTCHSSDPDVPPFATLPIGKTGSQGEHVSWIENMTDRMGRPEGAKGRMPKDRDGTWSKQEIELVKKWLAQGAPDDSGTPTAPVPGEKR